MSISIDYTNLGALSGVNGLADFVAWYEATYSDTGHAVSSGFSTDGHNVTLNGTTDSATIGGVYGIPINGTQYAGNSVGTTSAAFIASATGTTIESAAGASTDNVVSGSTGLDLLVYHFATHTLYGALDEISFGDTATLSGGTYSLGTTYLTVSNLTANIGNGLYDNDSDGVDDSILSRSTLGSNEVHDIVYGLMAGQGGSAWLDSLEAAFDAYGINVTGTSANEDIDSYQGDDTLTGGGGADQFVFHPSFGHDTVTDFSAAAGSNHDVLAFSSSIFATQAAAVAATVFDSLTGTSVTTAGTDTVTVTGLSSALTSSEFLII